MTPAQRLAAWLRTVLPPGVTAAVYGDSAHLVAITDPAQPAHPIGFTVLIGAVEIPAGLDTPGQPVDHHGGTK